MAGVVKKLSLLGLLPNETKKYKKNLPIFKIWNKVLSYVKKF